jgi:hypothetical protein
MESALLTKSGSVTLFGRTEPHGPYTAFADLASNDAGSRARHAGTPGLAGAQGITRGPQKFARDPVNFV